MSVNQELEQILLKVQKPGRYSGGEVNSIIKQPDENTVRFAFCFPDTYEVGMSHLGMKILYSVLNSKENVWCERVFAPWVDMEEQMRLHNVPLFGLESRDPITDFDFIGFTLQYELSFTNVLNMLSLANIPIRSSQRRGLGQIVIVGGPCACNPEPLADFVDLVSLGEGEEVLLEVVELYEQCRLDGDSRETFLKKAAQIDGIYVPSLYEVAYHEDGTVKSVTPQPGVPATVTKRVIPDFDHVFYPDKFVVPFIEVVHDRVMTEVLRGCIRGCRFCQAGYIYRPFREKSIETIDKECRDLCGSTGYDEISLSSLSTSDYSEITKLLDRLLHWSNPQRVNVSLPSMRVDAFSTELMDKLNVVRRSGLTFAPEAGTQRLRDAINKNVSEAQLMKTCSIAFEGGWTAVKLYFMIGLPTETLEDVEGIAQLSQRVVDCFYACQNRPKGKTVSVTISTACFVPKPFTPFQWFGQNTKEEFAEKQQFLKGKITTRKVNYNYHDSKTSFLEAVFARGDRRLCRVLEQALSKGCKFDSWDSELKFDAWMETMEECGLDPAFYANRRRELTEVLPWDHLDYGVKKDFLIREYEKAMESVTTKNCREQCSGCGANMLCGGGKCSASC